MNARDRFDKILFLIATAFIFSEAALFAQAKTYTVRQEDSHIGFAIYKWGVFKEEGRFKDFSGSIIYDQRNPAASRVEFTVMVKSIDSRNEGRDRALRAEEFFHVERHPTLFFRSTKVAAKGVDTLLVTGELTMRGVTKKLMIPVKVLGTHRLNDLGDLAGFESTFTVNREDFGIACGWDTLSKEVTINLMIGAASRVSSTSL